MSQQFTIGKEINTRILRDYIIEHNVDKGDAVVLNPLNFGHLVEEARHSSDGLTVPLKILGILIVNDTTNTVDVGKIQIIKNQNLDQ
ncbi:MAG: hypothetical protein EOO48_11905 [Flavobacterium sp.]|nr:MAG: hypothetical protein EOO48_11905 [Flavobacterium sp.]